MSSSTKNSSLLNFCVVVMKCEQVYFVIIPKKATISFALVCLPFHCSAHNRCLPNLFFLPTCKTQDILIYVHSIESCDKLIQSQSQSPLLGRIFRLSQRCSVMDAGST